MARANPQRYVPTDRHLSEQSQVPNHPSPVQPGFQVNWQQFSLPVIVNAFVGTMVSLEGTVLPLVAEADFGNEAKSVTLPFLTEQKNT